ncbi:MAG: pyridoxal 5'-phosphate synthase glutaminase subunit PdxT [Acidimicrobiales bacterium]
MPAHDGIGASRAASEFWRPRVGVLALQGDVSEHANALVSAGAAPVEVRSRSDLADLDGLVLPGGESTTMSMLLESSGLFEPLDELLHAGLPVFGTCAGMILLAHQIRDGRSDQRVFSVIDLTVRRNAFGRQVQSFECDLDVAELGPELGGAPLPAIFIRAPVIEAMGPEVEGLAWLPPGARSDSDRIDHSGVDWPVLCRQGPVLVASFHPELTNDGRIHRFFCQSIVRRET